ncbi:PepSY-associated TM helix domain-containing protein [Salinimonas marina]|nr:PepSY-associated TM helix domain-containing protein [Salinimonas marina]
MHLWIGLITALFVLILSVTGAMLIYAKDIQTIINPQYWTVAEQSSRLPISTLLENVEATSGQTVTVVSTEPEYRDRAWQLRLDNGEYVSVDPYTGEILLTYAFEEHLYGFTMSVHRWLLYRDTDNRTSLRNWVSVVALLFIFEVLFGFYLWVKPKKRLKRLKINTRAKTKILLYQLHTVLGVFLFLPLLLIAFSGIAFNWKAPTAAVVSALSPGQIEARPPVAEFTPGQQLAINRAIENGLRALPQATLFRIYMPASPGEALKLRVQMPGETHAYSWIWMNPFTAQVLQTFDASAASAATQVWNFKYKFHIGGFAGPIVEALWLIMALSPCFFVISGIYFWQHRRKSKPVPKFRAPKNAIDNHSL